MGADRSHASTSEDRTLSGEPGPHSKYLGLWGFDPWIKDKNKNQTKTNKQKKFV